MINRSARSTAGLLAGAMLALGATAAGAHHSFAVFFSSDQDVTSVTGTVKAYRFTNPHGLIEIIAKTKAGGEEDWKVETNSPSVLVRRGWGKDSLKVGEVITVQGWRARDGTTYMRMRNVQRADGTPVGTPAPGEAPKP
jgi:hypothetical protein